MRTANRADRFHFASSARSPRLLLAGRPFASRSCCALVPGRRRRRGAGPGGGGEVGAVAAAPRSEVKASELPPGRHEMLTSGPVLKSDVWELFFLPLRRTHAHAHAHTSAHWRAAAAASR